MDGNVLYVQLVNNPGFVQAYQTILAAVISTLIVVIGWVINHRLTLRAQYKSIELQYYNAARIELTSSLKEYNNFLQEISNYIIDINNSLVTPQDTDLKNIDLNSLTKLLDNIKHKWVYSLNEYETLIPDLELAESILCERQVEIESSMLNILKIINDGGDQKKLLNEVRHCMIYLTNQTDLISDLLLFLQNKCFSKVTGNAIPNKFSNVNQYRPRFIVKKGKLEYAKPNL